LGKLDLKPLEKEKIEITSQSRIKANLFTFGIELEEITYFSPNTQPVKMVEKECHN